MSTALHFAYIAFGILAIICAVVGNLRYKWTVQASILASLAGLVAVIAGVERSFDLAMVALLGMALWGFVHLPRTYGRRK